MKCPVCQSEIPDGKKHCADCGAELAQPEQAPEEQPIVAVSTEPKPRWLSAHRKGLVAVGIILVVVLASVGLIYTQPWSKIKVLIAHDQQSAIVVGVYIDDVCKAFVLVGPGGWKIAGVWSVTAGSHTVMLASDADALIGPFDGQPVWNSYACEVWPLSTKNAYIQV